MCASWAVPPDTCAHVRPCRRTLCLPPTHSSAAWSSQPHPVDSLRCPNPPQAQEGNPSPHPSAANSVSLNHRCHGAPASLTTECVDSSLSGEEAGVSMSWPPVPLCSGPRAGCLHTTQLCPGAVSPFLCHTHSGALAGGCASLHTSCKSSQELLEQPRRDPGWDKTIQSQPGGGGGGTFWEGDLTKPRLLRLQAGKVPAASLPSRATEGCRDYFFSLEIKIHFHIFKTL